MDLGGEDGSVFFYHLLIHKKKYLKKEIGILNKITRKKNS